MPPEPVPDPEEELAEKEADGERAAGEAGEGPMAEEAGAGLGAILGDGAVGAVPTMAEQELRRRIGQASEGGRGGTGRRTRSSSAGGGGRGGDMHRIRTRSLRRFREIFWDGDDAYGSGSGREPLPPAKRGRRGVAFRYNRRLQLRPVHESPHVYVMDGFLSEAELRHFEGKVEGAERGGRFRGSFVDGRERERRGSGAARKRKRGREEGEGEDPPPNASSEKKKDEEEPQASAGGEDTRQRTSTYIHFGKMADSRIAAVESRAAELLGLPPHCIEPLQLVRYAPGQYFRTHHDLGELYDDGSVELPPRTAVMTPRRMATILVYLNDLPPGTGGGTRFPLLAAVPPGEEEVEEEVEEEAGGGTGENGGGGGGGGGGGLVVRPARGRAVLWCNIDQDGLPEPRTVHEGMPLVRATAPREDSPPIPPPRLRVTDIIPREMCSFLRSRLDIRTIDGFLAADRWHVAREMLAWHRERDGAGPTGDGSDRVRGRPLKFLEAQVYSWSIRMRRRRKQFADDAIQDEMMEAEANSAPSIDATKRKKERAPPLLKYAINIWVCEE